MILYYISLHSPFTEGSALVVNFMVSVIGLDERTRTSSYQKKYTQGVWGGEGELLFQNNFQMHMVKQLTPKFPYVPIIIILVYYKSILYDYEWVEFYG